MELFQDKRVDGYYSDAFLSDYLLCISMNLTYKCSDFHGSLLIF